MKITKLGHCCLLIEINGMRIVTDPGVYAAEQEQFSNVDAVLITHEHPDHFHLDSLKKILQNSPNPDLKIITNRSVAKLLEPEGIAYVLVEHGQSFSIEGKVTVEGFGTKHAEILPSISPADNTGYFVDNKFFYPGDAFTIPGKPVEVLALPVAGPWLKISESIAYAENIKPKACFPVHDGNLKTAGVHHTLPQNVLSVKGIKFIIPTDQQAMEF